MCLRLYDCRGIMSSGKRNDYCVKNVYAKPS